MKHYLMPDGTILGLLPDGSQDRLAEGGRLLDAAELAQILEARRPAPSVPVAVSMRQARLALLQAGHLQGVEAAISGLPSPQKEAARIEWEYATEVRRDSPLLAMLADSLELESAELDALFLAGAAL